MAKDEKPEVERASHEMSKTSGSLKEKDAENNAMAGYLPQSDEEYNVTIKTWCVVIVSLHACVTGEVWTDFNFRSCPYRMVSAFGSFHHSVLVQLSLLHNLEIQPKLLGMFRFTL